MFAAIDLAEEAQLNLSSSCNANYPITYRSLACPPGTNDKIRRSSMALLKATIPALEAS